VKFQPAARQLHAADLVGAPPAKSDRGREVAMINGREQVGGWHDRQPFAHEAVGEVERIERYPNLVQLDRDVVVAQAEFTCAFDESVESRPIRLSARPPQLVPECTKPGGALGRYPGCST
jgi:hypothetical protein